MKKEDESLILSREGFSIIEAVLSTAILLSVSSIFPLSLGIYNKVRRNLSIVSESVYIKHSVEYELGKSGQCGCNFSGLTFPQTFSSNQTIAVTSVNTFANTDTCTGGVPVLSTASELQYLKVKSLKLRNLKLQGSETLFADLETVWEEKAQPERVVTRNIPMAFEVSTSGVDYSVINCLEENSDSTNTPDPEKLLVSMYDEIGFNTGGTPTLLVYTPTVAEATKVYSLSEYPDARYASLHLRCHALSGLNGDYIRTIVRFKNASQTLFEFYMCSANGGNSIGTDSEVSERFLEIPESATDLEIFHDLPTNVGQPTGSRMVRIFLDLYK